MIKLIVIALLFFCIIPCLAHSQLVLGVSPFFLDLGEIEPGSSRIARFQVVTPSDDLSLVRLKFSSDGLNVFNKDGYEKLIFNYSDEEITDWVEFIRNPVRLNKGEDQIRTGKRGKIKAANEVTFIVKVPEDADPGYHTGVITPYPIALQQPGMIAIQAVTQFNFIFKVPGNAVRDGKILGMSSGSYHDKGMNVEVFFKNTGTVTIKPKLITVKIFDDDNKIIDVLHSSVDYVKPGETKKFIAFWPLSDVKEGKYNATAEVNYLTGTAFKESVIEVYKPLMPPPKMIEKEFVFPFWILVVFMMIIVAYIIYRWKR